MAKTTAVLEVFIESVKPLTKMAEETDGMQKSKLALGHRKIVSSHYMLMKDSEDIPFLFVFFGIMCTDESYMHQKEKKKVNLARLTPGSIFMSIEDLYSSSFSCFWPSNRKHSCCCSGRVHLLRVFSESHAAPKT